MISKIIIYILSGVLAAAIGYGIFLYIENKRLAQELYDTENELFTEEQNVKALREREIMKDDSIQTYATEVGDLKNVNKGLEDDSKHWYTKHNTLLSKYSDLEDAYYVAITNYKIIYDSVFAKGASKPIIVGNLVVVPFSGTEKKVRYRGRTTFNVQDSTGKYEISIKREPTEIENNIRMIGEDEERTLISDIYADGILISNAKTIVDSSVYILLRRGLPEINEYGFWDRLKVGGGLAFYNPDITQVSSVDQYKLDLYLRGEYNFSNRIKVYFNKTLFDNAFSLGSDYLLPTSEIFK